MNATPTSTPPIDIPGEADLLSLYRPPVTGSSDQVILGASQIEQMIVVESSRPGKRLIEADLSQNLGIARGRVREALRILADSGLIELISQRGARVAEMLPGDVVSIIEALNGIVLKGMELFGARYGRPPAEIADALMVAMRRIEAAESTRHRASPRGMEYHVLINHLSGNLKLNMLIARLGVTLYERKLSDMLAISGRAEIVATYRKATKLRLADIAPDAIALLDDAGYGLARSTESSRSAARKDILRSQIRPMA